MPRARRSGERPHDAVFAGTTVRLSWIKRLLAEATDTLCDSLPCRSCQDACGFYVPITYHQALLAVIYNPVKFVSTVGLNPGEASTNNASSQREWFPGRLSPSCFAVRCHSLARLATHQAYSSVCGRDSDWSGRGHLSFAVVVQGLHVLI